MIALAISVEKPPYCNSKFTWLRHALSQGETMHFRFGSSDFCLGKYGGETEDAAIDAASGIKSKGMTRAIRRGPCSHGSPKGPRSDRALPAADRSAKVCLLLPPLPRRCRWPRERRRARRAPKT